MAQNTGRDDKALAPPYISIKTFRNFLDGLRANGVPGQIDRSVMPNMSGAGQSSLITTLRYLGLMSDKGVPHEILGRLVKSQGADRQKIIHDIVTTSYPFLFGTGFDVKTATARQLEEKFNNVGATGATGKKCISFFLGITKDAGMTVSTYLQNYSKRAFRNVGPGRSRRQSLKQPHIDGSEGEEFPPTPTEVSWQQMLLDKFPPFDPSWSEDVQGKWFEGFKELRKMMQEEE